MFGRIVSEKISQDGHQSVVILTEFVALQGLREALVRFLTQGFLHLRSRKHTSWAWGKSFPEPSISYMTQVLLSGLETLSSDISWTLGPLKGRTQIYLLVFMKASSGHNFCISHSLETLTLMRIFLLVFKSASDFWLEETPKSSFWKADEKSLSTIHWTCGFCLEFHQGKYLSQLFGSLCIKQIPTNLSSPFESENLSHQEEIANCTSRDISPQKQSRHWGVLDLCEVMRMGTSSSSCTVLPGHSKI